MLPPGQGQFTLTIREGPITPPLKKDKFAVPVPGVPNGSFTREPATEKDLQTTVLKRQPFNFQTAGDLCWSADGTAFYALYQTGLLVKAGLDGLVDQRRIELGRTPGAMAMSAQGLVVTLPPTGGNPGAKVAGRNEVWLIDRDTLQVKGRMGAFLRATEGGPVVASAPGLNFAYVASTGEDSAYPTTHGILVLDLINKRPNRFYDLPNVGLAVSPRGDRLFVMDNEVLTSFQINKETGDLERKETSHPYTRNGNANQRIEVSPDGKRVCVAGINAPNVLLRENPKLRPTCVPVYPVENLKKPAFAIEADFPVRAVGFDASRADRVLCQTAQATMALFDGNGRLQTSYRLPAVGNDQSPLQYLAHPNGTRMLIRFTDRLCHVTFKGEPGPGPAVVRNDPNWPTPVSVKDDSVALAAQKRGDVTYRELQLANLGEIDPCWDVGGRALFHLDTEGTLTRLSAGDFTPTDRLIIGRPAAAMGMSAQGLLVALRDQPEVWVINPHSLKVVRSIDCPSPPRFLACHPQQSLAAVIGAEVALLDLKQGKVAARGLQPHEDAGLPFHNPALTPDGKHLLLAHASGGSAKVLRVRIELEAGRLVVEESKNNAVKGPHAFCLTADGKHVAWFSVTGQGKQQPTAFYAVDQWQAPVFSLPVGARAMGSAADGSLYVQTTEFEVLQYAPPLNNGAAASTSLRWEGRIGIRALAAQPQHAGAFVASTGGRVYYGERAAR